MTVTVSPDNLCLDIRIVLAPGLVDMLRDYKVPLDVYVNGRGVLAKEQVIVHLTKMLRGDAPPRVD